MIEPENSLDDTSPRTPYDDRPITAAKEIMPDDDDPPYLQRESRGGGCGMTTLIFAVLGFFALMIVALSGAAGWVSGQRQASVNATATQSAAIGDQISRIPNDVASGNLVLLNARLQFLATLTPGVPGISDYAQTATALYMTSQPTATASPTNTPTETVTPLPTATPDPEQPSPTPGIAYDLAALLAEAQTAYATGNYSDAAELAEAISAIDPNYETVSVRTILGDSLAAQARNYYNAMQPAAGNRIVGQMEALGIPTGDLAYERTVGEVYLNAMSNIGISFPQAISALERLLSFGQGRYYQQATDLLYRQYVGYGDALAFDPNYGYCPAVAQYQNALRIYSSGDANGKLSQAEMMCAQATPQGGDPSATGTTDGVAPIGVPGS